MRAMGLDWPWARSRHENARTGYAAQSIRVWPLLALAAVLLLAGGLRFYNLSSLGYANQYYSAGIVSMLQSWHNFFFVAAEPGGAVSIDKPPVGFWLQAVSATIFGVNAFGLLLPEVLAGMASVVVLYHLVQRKFGQVAGLVAGLVLAITPVVVATDRNNTIDSILILTLLLAAWAFIRATESRKIRYLLLGAGLVGVGFNIKMLQAFLPLPAFYALYFFGAGERLLRKVGKLALATVLLLVISLSWITAVDLTPASQRPYVGSSGTNSAWNLAIGYNGVQRLLGMGGNSGSLATTLSSLFGSSDNSTNVSQPGQPPQARGQQEYGSSADGAVNAAPPAMPTGSGNPTAGPDGGGRGFDGSGGGGAFGTGQAGPLRLFTGSLSNEVSWLLPFGLFSGLLLALRSRLHWPLSEKHGAVVLWGGWLLTGGIFFSVAGFFHPYYLSMLAPPLAALVGLGVAELWQMRQERWPLALGLAMVAMGGTTALQFKTASTFVKTIWWLPLVVGLIGAGITLLAFARGQRQRIARIGFACLVVAMLTTPGIWSGLTTLYSKDSLPAAYSGESAGQQASVPGAGSGLQVDQTLLAYLQAHTQGVQYLMAVPNSNQGASYVIATGRPVLYLGGFNGQDQVETADSLAQLVANGELRYIYLGGQGGGPGETQSDITNWVTSTCKVVQYNTTQQSTETANGSSGNTSQVSFGGPRTSQGSLYECGQ